MTLRLEGVAGLAFLEERDLGRAGREASEMTRTAQCDDVGEEFLEVLSRLVEEPGRLAQDPRAEDRERSLAVRPFEGERRDRRGRGFF